MSGYDPAFPRPGSTDPRGEHQWAQSGMSQRLYIAIEAMPVVMHAESVSKCDSNEGAIREIARLSFDLAEAMLQEEDKR